MQALAEHTANSCQGGGPLPHLQLITQVLESLCPVAPVFSISPKNVPFEYPKGPFIMAALLLVHNIFLWGVPFIWQGKKNRSVSYSERFLY